MRRVLAPALLLVVAAAVGAIVLATMGGPRHRAATARAASGARATDAHSSSQTLNGTGFTTAYPGSWTLSSRSGPHRSAQYELSSNGEPVNGLGIAPSGTAAVTITDVAARGERLGVAFDLEGEQATSLLGMLVGTPRIATGVALAVAPRATTLAGVQAGEETYEYSYEGRRIVQVDVVAQHAGRVVLMEVDTEPRLAGESETALHVLDSHWHWR